MALLNTSADIGLLPESSANTMEESKIEREIVEMMRAGTIITEEESEDRSREHLAPTES